MTRGSPISPLLQSVVFQLGDEDMDSFVLALGKKKALLKMQKEYEDLVSCHVCMYMYSHHVGSIFFFLIQLMDTHFLCSPKPKA